MVLSFSNRGHSRSHIRIMHLILFQHEMASLAMFDYLVNDNDLKPVMEQHGLVLPEDLDFIKEQIAGPLDTNATEDQKQTGSSSV